MNTHEQRALVDRYIAAYNAFDIDGIMETIHRDIEFKNVSGGAVDAAASGESEFRALADQSKELFTYRKQTIRTFESHEGKAVVVVAYEAVLASVLPNGLKAGATIRLEGRSEFVFGDGRIRQLTDYS